MIVPETEIEKSRTDDGLLSAFVVPKEEVKRFKSDVLRTRIEQNAVTETEAIEALDAFVTFNHKNYLRKTGRPQASLRHAERSRRRSTHCSAKYISTVTHIWSAPRVVGLSALVALAAAAMAADHVQKSTLVGRRE